MGCALPVCEPSDALFTAPACRAGKQLIPTLVLPSDPPGMAESSHRRASSPLVGACLPPPILEDEEEEELCESSKTGPPNSLPLPNTTGSAKQDLYSPQFLCVDESKRPRAHSDPSVHVGGFVHYILPEITVTEDDAGGDPSHAVGASKAGCHLSLMQPLETSRKRSNTCPEDLFRPSRKGRPATPPPTDIVPVLAGKRRAHSAGGPRRFSFNFAPPPAAMKSPTSVSFAHHKLSKVNEDLSTECSDRLKSSSSVRKRVDKSLPPESHTSSHNTDNPTSVRETNCSSVSDSTTCSTYLKEGPQHRHEQRNSTRLVSDFVDSDIPSSTPSNSRIPPIPTTNGTFPGSNYTQDLYSSVPPASHSETAAALLSESFRTVSLTEGPLRDSCDPQANERASGFSKDSLTSWRAGDKSESGHLAAV
ncbi:hypothetical protein ElyMa_006385000 [Elysia marginata]|uniref:Uncharacterized protein n=1 Tax=Elysia marginata TaxID=1093978 RepID=A0AAV4HPS2_9GAST|nr:hypothetical protein ElyMa_006385000 [Elysia marginata]